MNLDDKCPICSHHFLGPNYLIYLKLRNEGKFKAEKPIDLKFPVLIYTLSVWLRALVQTH